MKEGLDNNGIELAANDCGKEEVAPGSMSGGRGKMSFGDGNRSSLNTPSSSKKRGGSEDCNSDGEMGCSERSMRGASGRSSKGMIPGLDVDGADSAP